MHPFMFRWKFQASGVKTVFTATTRSNNTKLFWHIDETYIGTTEKFHQMAVNPIPGKHSLTIEDENGESITRNFEILAKETR
jgi:penicillin-binding protein 1C